MPTIKRTVFICYRRDDWAIAQAIYEYLTNREYDVFLDRPGIASGDFESVIIKNIKARDHFLVLLTPSALQRCSDRNDWLRREIETALTNQRNIVPVMLGGFDFRAPDIAKQLRGKLADLKRYNGLPIPPTYFEKAMEDLCNRFLSVAPDEVPHPRFELCKTGGGERRTRSKTRPSDQPDGGGGNHQVSPYP